MTIVSLVLVVGGFLGSTLGPHWLIVLAFGGLFGPFALRELGLQTWRDDFQREAVMRSGMHALLAVGALLTLVMAKSGYGGSTTGEEPIQYLDAFPLSVVFLVLAVTWGLSWLLQFWGVRSGSFRIVLMTMATITVLTVVSLAFMAAKGQPQSWHGIWTGSLQLGIGWVLVLITRWRPRVAGGLLLAVVAWEIWFVARFMVQRGDLAMMLVLSLLVLPLVVPGVALIVGRDESAA